jgi:hypothetical protein
MDTNTKSNQKIEIDPRTKLKIRLFIKQLARKNIDIVYNTIDQWKIERRKLAKKRQDTTLMDFKIEELNREIERLEGEDDFE